MVDHLKDILAGTVTKTNVIGIRKAINAEERRERGWSVSSTAPKLCGDALAEVERRLRAKEPRVVGKLHDTGLRLLTSPRYRKRLEPVREIIANLESFHLVAFDRIDEGTHAVPVFRAKAKGGKSFFFRNVPWQSGGNGPEILGKRSF